MKLAIAPIKYITDWSKLGGDKAMIEHCEHIISHAERYERERVFEAKTIIDNLKINNNANRLQTISS